MSLSDPSRKWLDFTTKQILEVVSFHIYCVSSLGRFSYQLLDLTLLHCPDFSVKLLSNKRTYILAFFF